MRIKPLLSYLLLATFWVIGAPQESQSAESRHDLSPFSAPTCHEFFDGNIGVPIPGSSVKSSQPWITISKISDLGDEDIAVEASNGKVLRFDTYKVAAIDCKNHLLVVWSQGLNPYGTPGNYEIYSLDTAKQLLSGFSDALLSSDRGFLLDSTEKTHLFRIKDRILEKAWDGPPKSTISPNRVFNVKGNEITFEIIMPLSKDEATSRLYEVGCAINQVIPFHCLSRAKGTVETPETD